MSDESNKLNWNQLHDTTLVRLEFSWESGDATIFLTAGIPQTCHFQIHVSSCSHFDCPRHLPWGASVSINEFRGPYEFSQGLSRIEIEMQSGDVITIEAKDFLLAAG